MQNICGGRRLDGSSRESQAGAGSGNVTAVAGRMAGKACVIKLVGGGGFEVYRQRMGAVMCVNAGKLGADTEHSAQGLDH